MKAISFSITVSFLDALDSFIIGDRDAFFYSFLYQIINKICFRTGSCYAPETSIAEKLHSILRHELLNSRMKDFYDIWLFMHALDLDETCLLKAIAMTFRARKTPIDTNSVVFKEEFFRDKNKQKQWIAFLRKRHITDAPGKFSDIAREVMSFLKPFLLKISTSE